MAIIGKANPFFALWAAPDGRRGHESQGDMGSSRQGSLGWAGGHPALLWMSILCVRYERPLKGDILSVHLYRIKRQESVSVHSDGNFLQAPSVYTVASSPEHDENTAFFSRFPGGA